MKKILFLTLAAVACSAFAGPAKPAAPTKIACAVMPAHKVTIADAIKKKMFADYKGRRYFFCCGGCPAEFKANPEKYKNAPSVPAPKTK